MELLLQNGEGGGNKERSSVLAKLCVPSSVEKKRTLQQHSKECTSQKAIASISAQLNLQQSHKIYSEVKTAEGEEDMKCLHQNRKGNKLYSELAC